MKTTWTHDNENLHIQMDRYSDGRGSDGRGGGSVTYMVVTFTEFMRFIELNSSLTGNDLYEYAKAEWDKWIAESESETNEQQ